jgi:hypothetical protein
MKMEGGSPGSSEGNAKGKKGIELLEDKYSSVSY